MLVRVIRICASLVLLCALFPLTASPVQADEPDYDSDRAIVGIKSKDKVKAKDAVEELGGEVEEVSESGYFMVVETPEDSKNWAAKLKGDNRVKYVEPDYEVQADALPTDPRYPELWAMPKIGMPAAWDLEDGSSSVIVGVNDSGIDYTHEDLASQMWINDDPVNGVDDDGNGWVDDRHGIDCRNNDGNPIDDYDHGTHVAGTIGADANNGKGVAGVNWNVSLMALKFLGSTGSGSTSDAAECLHYAIDNGAHVTNNSWGGGGFSQTM
ncbi:MAG TPA: S8 family serine peptidase, partial [Actinomycetota bacterium]|nr:S8 family serine peptidase [Actinomycetota bacterium]